MLTMVHSNPVLFANGILEIDRKFHTGMNHYVENIPCQIVSIHPEHTSENLIMDPVQIPFEQLKYQVLVMNADELLETIDGRQTRLKDQIGQSKLVYGASLRGIEMAHAMGVPYIIILEYDLGTQIVVTATQTSGLLRRAVRAVRCVSRYIAEIPAMRGAQALHCNGYPVYDQSRFFNRERLLYLDSRLSDDLLIPEEQLNARLSGHGSRALRLLYSGRYEPLKGAVDAVRVARECLRRGLDIEMHCYGQGGSESEMRQIASDPICHGKVRVHAAIPYPELVEISRGFDVFVCCHVQSDPSCTYLESFGSGLPIVGYANRMWSRLRQDSQAGMSSPIGNPVLVAENIQRLMSADDMLAGMSRRARRFAAEHTFHTEFKRRTDHLNDVLNAL